MHLSVFFCTDVLQIQKESQVNSLDRQYSLVDEEYKYTRIRYKNIKTITEAIKLLDNCEIKAKEESVLKDGLKLMITGLHPERYTIEISYQHHSRFKVQQLIDAAETNIKYSNNHLKLYKEQKSIPVCNRKSWETLQLELFSCFKHLLRSLYGENSDEEIYSIVDNTLFKIKHIIT